MLQNSITNLIKGTLSGALIVVLIIALICIVPMIAIWAINSFADAGGSSFYIEHGLWNYFLCLIMLILVRGGK
jgi:fatty-acid desaturase